MHVLLTHNELVHEGEVGQALVAQHLQELSAHRLLVILKAQVAQAVVHLMGGGGGERGAQVSLACKVFRCHSHVRLAC